MGAHRWHSHAEGDRRPGSDGERQREHVVQGAPGTGSDLGFIEAREARGTEAVNGSEELRLLAEIARWTREAALPIVRERVERLLDSEPKKRVYEALAEGTMGVSAIEKATGVNHNEINKWV